MQHAIGDFLLQICLNVGHNLRILVYLQLLNHDTPSG